MYIYIFAFVDVKVTSITYPTIHTSIIFTKNCLNNHN